MGVARRGRARRAAAPRRGGGHDVHDQRRNDRTDDADDAGASRGLVGRLAKKALHVLAFDLIDKVAGEVGDYFVSRWEAGARPHLLRTFTPADHDKPALRPLDEAELRGWPPARPCWSSTGPTASPTRGSAGFPTRSSPASIERYEGRVFAFDHPTLSVDPVENCRRLAEMLPTDAGLVVDVLAHSSGGLVARMLTERADDVDIDSARLRVRQVVFVATPNHGTPLADPDHLGSLVDALTNIVDLVPDNPASPVLDTITGSSVW